MIDNERALLSKPCDIDCHDRNSDHVSNFEMQENVAYDWAKDTKDLGAVTVR